MYIGSAKAYDFCMLVYFAFMYALLYACTSVCFHQLSNVRIVRTFKKRITIQLFEKWHNISYCYISYIKSEASDICRTGVWFLKPFKGRIEKKHIYDLVKPNSTKKEGVTYITKLFLENGKIDFKNKILNFDINFQA